MRSAWIIATKDLALRMRDRSMFIIGLIAPLALAFIFNLVFGGGINDVGQTVTFDFGLVDEDPGELSDAFVEILESIEEDGLAELTVYDDVEAGQTAATDGEVGAVFVLGEDFSSAVVAGDDTGIEIVGNVDAPTTTNVAGSIAEQFALGVRRANAAAVTSLVTGVIGPQDLAAVAMEAGQEPPPLTLGVVEAATRQLDSATHLVASMSIFFVFFIGGIAVTGMLEERREGTMGRLLGAPIPSSSILGGKAITAVLIGVVSLAVLVVASTLLMGADWGDPLGVALMIVSGVLAIVALMTTVGGLAKTPEQAGNLQSIVAVTMAMLGGTFVPITDPESFLGKLSLITPNAWFIRGLSEMAGGTVADALPAVGVLLGLTVVFGAIGMLLVRKAVHL